MNSPSDPLSDSPEWEIWGVVGLRYVSAVGLVILIHDTLLTLDDEVRLIFLVGFPASLPVPRFALFGQGPFPGQKRCITPIAIYPLSLFFIQTTVSTTVPFGWRTRALKLRLPEISGFHPPLTPYVGFFHSSSPAPKVLIML